jgi:hypothetical protein
VPPPPAWSPQVHNVLGTICREPPPAPALHADRHLATRFADISTASNKIMREVEVVSSQASTADTLDNMWEDAASSQLDTGPQLFHEMQAPSRCRPQVLRLQSILALADERQVVSSEEPHLGSPELPSVGSLGHYVQRCKPCAFVTKMGCANGIQCRFCHLCGPGEKKRRRKEKRCLFNAARRLALQA